MDDHRQERRLTTILSMDVVGYSTLISQDESGTVKLLRHLRRSLIDPRINLHKGRTIKLMGDGSLLEFASVLDAVSFAVDVQHALISDATTPPIQFRIGINVGDIIVDGDDIYGDGVNVAARIEALAEPGGVCISRAVHDHVAAKLDLAYEPMGEQTLKNIPAPVEVWRILPDDSWVGIATDAKPSPKVTPEHNAKSKRWIAAAAVAVLFSAAVLVYLLRSGTDAPPVIAVLPFQDISAEEDRGLLSDPLSDGILAHLARYPELTVIARGSSFRYRDEDRDLREIGSALNADYILEGSLTFANDQLAVNASLVDVEKNAQVWSDQIAADVDDLMVIVADIGQRVAYQVEDFLGQVRVAEAQPFKADALLMTMRTRRATMRGLSQENNASIIEMNQQTIDLYPDQAWGHLAMAFALRTKVRFGWADDPEETLARAVTHGETAIRLAPDNYSAYFALGRVRMQQGDHRRAIEAFDTALTLNPSSADTLNALSQAYFYLGDDERALEILAQSARIDPLPSFVHSWMSAWVLWQEERCEDASDAFARIASPPTAAHKLAAVIEVCLGNTDKAQSLLQVFMDANPGWTTAREADLQDGVWTYAPGRERWIDNLATAGMPAG